MWKDFYGEGVKIVVIDSGVSLEHAEMQGANIKGVSIINDNNGNYIIGDDINDNLGHGTAVTSIIKKMAPKAEIFVIKIFQDELLIDIEKLIFSMKYVLENIDCHILHLSLGVVVCPLLSELREICNNLRKKNILIVSAFDNSGALSFPASFKTVIGVDNHPNCKKDYDFEYIEGSAINLLAKGMKQKVPWINNEYNYIGGSSFSAAYITGIIAKIISSGILGFDNVSNTLKKSANRYYISKPYTNTTSNIINIQRAVAFPFNKEIQSLVRYSDLLCFDLIDVYDTKYLGQINQSATKTIKGIIPKDYIVKNIINLDWNSNFDTFILGHTKELSKLVKFDFTEMILNNCMKYNKNLYCFDDLSEYSTLLSQAKDKGLTFFYPFINKSNIPSYRMGKLRQVGKPVIGIFGTGSRQGKFTLQLSLRKLFLEQGYRVGQLGTEPSSLLYGFDKVYPMGYGSTVRISGLDAIHVINNIMGEIEDVDPEIIIVGSQSCTIPLQTTNLDYFSMPQIEFLLGTQPDIFVLCVNVDDDIDYIRRTINVLENLTHGKVLGVVIFPIIKEFTSSTSYLSRYVDEDAVNTLKTLVVNELKITSYTLFDQDDIQKLYNEILDYLS